MNRLSFLKKVGAVVGALALPELLAGDTAQSVPLPVPEAAPVTFLSSVEGGEIRYGGAFDVGIRQYPSISFVIDENGVIWTQMINKRWPE